MKQSELQGPLTGDKPGLTFWQGTYLPLLTASEIALQFLYNISICTLDMQQKKTSFTFSSLFFFFFTGLGVCFCIPGTEQRSSTQVMVGL